MLTAENEIVLLQYLTSGLLTLKYHFGHIAGHEFENYWEKAQYLYIYSMANMKKPSFFFCTIKWKCLLNSYGVWCPCFLVGFFFLIKLCILKVYNMRIRYISTLVQLLLLKIINSSPHSYLLCLCVCVCVHACVVRAPEIYPFSESPLFNTILLTTVGTWTLDLPHSYYADIIIPLIKSAFVFPNSCESWKQ